MAEVCTEGTKRLLIGWFFFCIALTYLRIMPVANLAHGTGFVFGVVYGYAAFGADGKRHLAWLCGAGVMTGAVLAMLIACPGHEQYDQARRMKQKSKAIEQLLRSQGQSETPPIQDSPECGKRASTWLIAGLSPQMAYVGSPGRIAAEEMDPVDAGKRAFQSGWGGAPPWYDSSKDAAKPITFRRPWWEGWDWLDDGEGPVESDPDRASSWLRILGWIGISVLAVLIVFALVSYLRSGEIALSESSKRSDASDRQRIEALPFPVRSTYGNLLEAAEAHYREGRFGEAIKFLFSYQLVELDRARYIRLTKGKTNRRYLREMRGHVAVMPWIEQTMIAFEDYFFGNYTIERARFEQCWSQLPQFKGFLDQANRASRESADARNAS